MPQAPIVPGSGDRLSSALEGIVVRYERLLRHVAHRYGVDAELIDDVLQEVRVRLWQARPAGETIASLGVSYIYRTAVSAALSVVRRNRTSGVSPARGGDLAAPPRAEEHPASAASGPEQRLARAEVARQVAEAVDALGDGRRAAVKLHLVGYSGEEIADTMGWSRAKARNLIYRGLADVRAALSQRGIGPGELS